MTTNDNYEYVKKQKPEAYRRAVEIGSFVSSYINFADPVDHLELASRVEKTIMELLAQTIQDLKSPSTTQTEPSDYEFLVGQFFASRNSNRVIRVVDYTVVSTQDDGHTESTFLVANHHSDGRQKYSNTELSYAELSEEYDLTQPLSFK